MLNFSDTLINILRNTIQQYTYCAAFKANQLVAHMQH